MDPVASFSLREVAPADGSLLGRQYAARMVGYLKATHTALDPGVLRGYLFAWNVRGGEPFTQEEISRLARVPATVTPKPPPPPEGGGVSGSVAGGPIMIWASQLPNMPQPKLVSFSFGGGVQSTVLMALLKLQPELFTKAGLTLPTVAMWADTGAETFATMAHVQRLQEWGLPIPLRIVRGAKNGADLDQIGRPPWLVRNPDGGKGQVTRSCTDKWKIRPLERACREAAGYSKGQRADKGSIHLWIGISVDEIQRAKDNRNPVFVNLYPLLEIGWTRGMCVEFLRETFPWKVPKSACFFCPFRAPRDWSRLRREEPLEWERALAWDALLRSDDPQVRSDLYLEGDAFLHPARVPLAQAVQEWEDERARRDTGATPLFPEFDAWDQECSGLCGV